MSQPCRFELENDRGQKLQGVEFLPSGKQWATLIWNHGVCEHKERYVPGEVALDVYEARLVGMFCCFSSSEAEPRHLQGDLSQCPCTAVSAVAVFEQLANAGVAVYCFDVHGHGESEPKQPDHRGLIKSYTHLVRICLGPNTA
jgi:hypothetical protein